MELITKAKEILVGVWSDTDIQNDTYPTSGNALDYVIADTLSVTQDDAEAQTFEFETSDAPETTYTAGAYKVDLNNAELSEKFVKDIMGWIETTIGDGDTANKGYVAPETFSNRYICLQVKFSDTCYFFLPKVSIAPKLVMESVKTNLVYGTLSGTAANCKVGTGENAPRTSIGKFPRAVITKATE